MSLNFALLLLFFILYPTPICVSGKCSFLQSSNGTSLKTYIWWFYWRSIERVSAIGPHDRIRSCKFSRLMLRTFEHSTNLGLLHFIPVHQGYMRTRAEEPPETKIESNINPIISSKQTVEWKIEFERKNWKLNSKTLTVNVLCSRE